MLLSWAQYAAIWISIFLAIAGGIQYSDRPYPDPGPGACLECYMCALDSACEAFQTFVHCVSHRVLSRAVTWR